MNYPVKRITKKSGLEMNLSKAGFIKAINDAEHGSYKFNQILAGETLETVAYIYVANK